MQTNRTTKIATQFRGLHGMSAVTEFSRKTSTKTSKAKNSKPGSTPTVPANGKHNKSSS